MPSIFTILLAIFLAFPNEGNAMSCWQSDQMNSPECCSAKEGKDCGKQDCGDDCKCDVYSSTTQYLLAAKINFSLNTEKPILSYEREHFEAHSLKQRPPAPPPKFFF